MEVVDGELRVSWSDGHAQRISLEELRRMTGGDPLPEKIYWDRNVLPESPVVQYEDLRTHEGTRRLASNMRTYGFSVVRDVPRVEERVNEVGKLLGVIRTTSLYGETWNVRVRPIGHMSTDSAYSGDEILHHTDMNYAPQTTPLQLLHCMVPGSPGTGISSLIDGFAVAEEVRRQDPEAFKVLSTTPVKFQFLDDEHSLLTIRTIFEVDHEQRMVSVSWNNLDRAVLEGDERFVKALRLWDKLLQDERFHLDFMLQQGELVVFDNRRAMHARKGPLEAGSPRNYYGFYLDDGIDTAIRKPRTLPPAPSASEVKADLRSDTKTQPDEAMKKAMFSAILGDDVARECPTTRALEEHVAAMMGTEDALLVASGTQGNLLALAAQCPRGTEFIVGADSHVHLWEAGGPSVLFGVMQRTVAVNDKGELPLEALRQALAASDPEDDHCCRTRLVAIENSHGCRGGAALDPAYVTELADVCRSRGLRLHVDGARFLNAAVAVAAPGDSLVEAARRALGGASSVSLCLSKGLGCPGGAVIAGDAATVAEARRLRKLVGGSMRQAMGIMAAAGLHVLRDRDTLADLRRDHALMRRLVESLRDIPGVSVDAYGGTNMCQVSLEGSAEAVAARGARVSETAAAAGVRCGSYLGGAGGWRFVTHRGVEDGHIDAILRAFRA